MDDQEPQPGPAPLSRRALLRAAPLVPLLGIEGEALAQGRKNRAGPSIAPGLITRETEALNLEFPFSTLDSFLVPNERFYVRNHFPQPQADAESWRLKVEGAVQRPTELTLEEIRRMPSRTLPALLECAGNGRVYLNPRQAGLQWELGAVGTAEWTGVPLAAVLERAGVRAGAVEVILEGADRGTVRDEPRSPGEIPFARSLPLTKARSEEVLLVYRMNGRELPPAHGFPLRAVVPGWYGMASVKWLRRLLVTEQPFQGFFQTMQYAYWRRIEGEPTLVPITELQVKAQIARPAPYEIVPAGRPYRVFGAAWTGAGEIGKVEVSADGGQAWNAARLTGDSRPYAWRFWEWEWRVPGREGRQVLMARATDSQGRTQPATRDPDRRSTMISHILPVEVEIR